MLRVMKEKVKSSVSGESSHQSGADSLVESPVDHDKTPLISNLPQSINVPTPQLPSSSNSSISSEGLHYTASLTKVSDDETTSGHRVLVTTEDSPVESSQPAAATIPPSDCSATQKRFIDTVLARKVSASDLEESEGSDTCVPQKRRKLSPAPPPPLPSVRLLAMPQDCLALNALHAFCRMQIEVFAATPIDVVQPAPGRKTPIKLHQVGLRCVHCRHLTSRDRVKRAVCYPRSLSRVYHSVSDMKFDHFPHCQGFSPELRAKFEALKQECKRGSERKDGFTAPASSTAQYYHDSACQMGLVDSKENNGIFMAGQVLDPSQLPASMMVNKAAPPVKPPTGVPTVPIKMSATIPPPSTAKLLLLATPQDPSALNGLHCFVRRNIEVFVTTDEDAAAPSPGRRTRVKVGQVGLRCIHCAQLPLKDRVKRAVCYPPSISGIYHSVSNMKFDHFSKCKGLSMEARIEFANLRATSSRRNCPNSNGSRGVSSSTAQYYEESAVRLGLVDTEGGIQFRNHESDKLGTGEQGTATDGISALMIAAMNPRMMRAEFDRCKALSEAIGANAKRVTSV